MIQQMKNNKGSVAKFGNGTIRILPYTLQSRYGGQIELTTCRKSIIGAEVSKENIVKECSKIVLDFSTIESLDVLIEKLQILRNDMSNETKV